MEQLCEFNYQFFLKTCEVFSSSQEFNKIFALFLAKLPADKLEIVLKDTLKVNIYSFNITQRDALFEEFYQNATQEYVKILVLYIYSEWEKLLDLHTNPGTPILPELIVTDFPRHILCHLTNEIAPEFIVENANSVMISLKDCNNKWYVDFLHFRNDILVLLSRLYLYSYAFRQMKINNTALSIEVENLSKNPFLQDIFTENRIIYSIDQIKQNFQIHE